MTEDRNFKFKHDIGSADFSRALSQRVDRYFRDRRRSKHADWHMVSKTILAFAMWIGIYLVLMSDRYSTGGVVGLYVLLGFAQLFMAFNVAHDANHGAYSKHRAINRALSCVFDLVGVSSYIWRRLHNDSHHSFVNVRGADTTLVSDMVFRFSVHDKGRRFHRYQHLYAPLLYCLATLDWVLVKDYRWLFANRFGNRRIVKHPPGEIAILFAGKAFYYTYVLALPLLYLSVPWYTIVGAFVLSHFFTGFTIALIFQPNHFNEHASFPEPDEQGHIANNYIRHIFDTTSDYARQNPVANWALGCLNLHVIHHMFPRVCHVHYPALTQIVRSTAAEHGLVYREHRTISGAFLAHLRWLRVVGRADASPAPTRRNETHQTFTTGC